MNKYFDKFNTYFRIASKISSFRNSDQHLQNILKEIMDVGGIQRGMVLLSDDSGEYLLLKAHHGISANLLGVLQKSRIDETTLAAQVFSTAESFVAKCSDKIDAPFKSLTKPGEPCFFVCCPIKTSRKVLGLMVLHSRDFKETFIKNDLVPLEAICRILGETIENCFENSKTIHTEKELKLLHNINAALNSAAGLTEVLDTITEGMVKVFGYTGSLIFLDNKGDGTTITLKSLAYDYKPSIVRKIESLLGFSLKGHEFEPEKENTIHLLFHEQLPYITNNISRQLEELFQSKTLKKLTPALARLLPVRSALTIPLVMGKKVKGILVVASRQELNEHDVSLVQAFATQASLAIETARHYREEQRHTTELSILQSVSKSMSSTLNLTEILQNATRQIVELLHMDHCGILIFDENQEWGTVLAEYPKRGAASESFPLKVDESAKRIIADPKPLVIKDARHDPLVKEIQDIINNLDIRSMLILPLIIKGKTIGSIGLDSIGKQRIFKLNEIALAQTVTDQISVSIENARLFEAEQSRRQFAEALSTITKIVTSTLDLDSRIYLILRELSHLLYFDTVSIMIFKGKELIKGAVLGYVDEELVRREIPLRLKDSLLLHEIVRTHHPIYISDVREEKKWIWVSGARNVRSWMGIPLIARNVVIGIISIDRFETASFSQQDVKAVQALANQTAVAIENSRLYEELKKSEERFRYVTANTGDWVWEVDIDGHYIYSSPLVEQILGHTVQEISGKYFWDSFCTGKREELRIATINIFQTKKSFTSFVNYNYHKNGRTVILESSGIPIFDSDGQLSGYRGVNHDITARVLAEEALATSERRYRTLVEDGNAWVWTLDCQGLFTYFNQVAERATGYKSADWIGKSLIPILPKEDILQLKRIFIETLAGKKQSCETQILTNEGKLLTLSVNTAPLYEGNKIIGTVSMGLDVTIQKQLEKQLREAQKMEALGTLAGGIAHDFNNILSGVLGYSAYIKSELPQDSPLNTELDSVITLVHRAADLTRQLLGFARGGRYQIEPININHTIDEVVGLLSHTIDKAIILKPILSPNLAAIEGDEGQIQQMILNLCLNACDAILEGGKIIIETKNVTFDDISCSTISEIEPGIYTLVIISDSGTGMDIQTKARIFDPFFSTKEGQGQKKHSGLGLSMVYGIVKNHKGYISVESETGCGTTFRVYFPSSGKEVANIKDKMVTPIKRGGETLLLVDDEEIILKITKRFLNKAGYKVLLANGGKEALSIFREKHKEIALIILDMIMPEMSGKEVYKRLKEIDPDIKVLLSSGYSKESQAQELFNLGTQGFLQKPYEFSELLQATSQILEED